MGMTFLVQYFVGEIVRPLLPFAGACGGIRARLLSQSLSELGGLEGVSAPRLYFLAGLGQKWGA